ncbi:MAG: alpha/beta fold hydrolase [Oscillospiraceae bacterium]|nr:alpha/beta fold hydrolase [Oscillospiraceae bacterium]
MKLRFAAAAAALLTAFVLSGCGNGGGQPDLGVIDWEDRDGRAEQFVMALVNGEYAAAAAGFDAAMRRGLGERGLQKAWEDTAEAAGRFLSLAGIEVVPHDEYDIYEVLSRHEKTGIKSRVVFSPDGLVAGLFFSFAEDLAAWDMAPAVKDGYTEFPIILGEGTEYPLRGMLTVPDGVSGKVPGVVLVHGSGPQDMDETVFENKPFLEIAEYLSANGFAVIRYDKRTYTHGAKMLQELGGSLSVWEETIEDAILATEMLKADSRIDRDRVFILGHSLGGMLAPRIHAMGGDYAGLILFAGSPRSLLEIIADQQRMAVLETLEGEALEAALEAFELADEQIAAIVNMPDDEAKATTDASGASVYYWKDLHTHSAADYIEDITAPILVMHAGNDMQVFADKDFAGYQELLAGRDNVTFKLYEGLNHLFMPSDITRRVDILDEYAVKANIDGQVLRDIAEWLRAFAGG